MEHNHPTPKWKRHFSASEVRNIRRSGAQAGYVEGVKNRGYRTFQVKSAKSEKARVFRSLWNNSYRFGHKTGSFDRTRGRKPERGSRPRSS